MSILKYAMTADGKIATTTGHSSWVSGSASRQLVFDTRARSDAIVVGGNTVRISISLFLIYSLHFPQPRHNGCSA